MMDWSSSDSAVRSHKDCDDFEIAVPHLDPSVVVFPPDSGFNSTEDPEPTRQQLPSGKHVKYSFVGCEDENSTRTGINLNIDAHTCSVNEQNEVSISMCESSESTEEDGEPTEGSMKEGPNQNVADVYASGVKRPHIMIIYTGGTIGMVSTKEGYAPKKGYFTKMVPEILRTDERSSSRRETAWMRIPTFEVIEYEPLLDSSNMNPKNWQTIAQHIYDSYEDADGFIIIHGTDTMTYTASALSFLLQNLSKPVILTGAQVPLCELRTDAHSNLIGALQVAALPPKEAINEVCIYFNGLLIRGNRAIKSSSDSMAGFTSPSYPHLAELGINITTYADRFLQKARGPLRLHKMTEKANEVIVVRLYPGIDGEDLECMLSAPVKAAILLTYGIGNSSTSNAFLSVIKNACDRGLVIVNVTQCPEGTVFNKAFETGRKLTQCGVVSGQGMTVEACYTKLLFLLGFDIPLSTRKLNIMLQEDHAGEIEKNNSTMFVKY